MRHCCFSAVGVSVVVFVASLGWCACADTYESHDEYGVPVADVDTEWTVYSGFHYLKVDEVDWDDPPMDAVYTGSTDWVTDQYNGGVKDGTWNGGYDHMVVRVVTRTTGASGPAKAELECYFKRGGGAWSNDLDLGIPSGSAWFFETSDTTYSGGWTETQAENSQLKLRGYRERGCGLLRVDEIHLCFWDD